MPYEQTVNSLSECFCWQAFFSTYLQMIWMENRTPDRKKFAKNCGVALKERLEQRQEVKIHHFRQLKQKYFSNDSSRQKKLTFSGAVRIPYPDSARKCLRLQNLVVLTIFECATSCSMEGVTFPQKSKRILIVRTWASLLGVLVLAICSR